MLSSHHSVRLDKWLWAARFYKTRRLAVDAIKNGKIKINGENSKPARVVKQEDLLSINQGIYQVDLIVIGLNDKRGAASVAKTLYKETLGSKVRRQKLSLQLKSATQQVIFDRKKPDQRNRGLSRKAKRGD